MIRGVCALLLMGAAAGCTATGLAAGAGAISEVAKTLQPYIEAQNQRIGEITAQVKVVSEDVAKTAQEAAEAKEAAQEADSLDAEDWGGILTGSGALSVLAWLLRDRKYINKDAANSPSTKAA